MNKILWVQNIWSYAGIGIVIALVLSLLWDSSNGLGGSEIFTGIALLLTIGSLLYLKSMQDVTERDILRRIRTEYSPDAQSLVFDVYQRLKIKEMEGLFSKILDDASGDANKVKKLASVAESIGWKAFIENEW